MIRTQIQIQTDQMTWLKRTALSKGVSMAQMIRDSIDFYRAHTEKNRHLMKKKKNALAAVGSFSSTEKT
jgi:hypothetical protein